jgi:hypothetical protein
MGVGYIPLGDGQSLEKRDLWEEKRCNEFCPN